jgi:Aldehyde dehydrogenase family
VATLACPNHSWTFARSEPPADLVPGSGNALAGIISRSGLPKGVFNLVMGRGSIVGEAFLNTQREFPGGNSKVIFGLGPATRTCVALRATDMHGVLK